MQHKYAFMAIFCIYGFPVERVFALDSETIVGAGLSFVQNMEYNRHSSFGTIAETAGRYNTLASVFMELKNNLLKYKDGIYNSSQTLGRVFGQTTSLLATEMSAAPIFKMACSGGNKYVCAVVTIGVALGASAMAIRAESKGGEIFQRSFGRYYKIISVEYNGEPLPPEQYSCDIESPGNMSVFLDRSPIESNGRCQILDEKSPTEDEASITRVCESTENLVCRGYACPPGQQGLSIIRKTRTTIHETARRYGSRIEKIMTIENSEVSPTPPFRFNSTNRTRTIFEACNP